MYTTRHFPADFARPSEREFILRALAYYGARAIKRWLIGIFNLKSQRWRDAKEVRAAYDAERGYTLDHMDRLTFDELVYGSADRFDQVRECDFVLLNDRIQWAPTRDSRRFLIQEIERRITELVPAGGTVAEFGSGSGRNLLYLKSCLPDRQFIGLELSPVSVQLARRLSARYEHPVRFEVANACESLPHPPTVPTHVDLAFSTHALEMMPRTFVRAIDNMLSIASRHVLFFEPIPELWPSTPRGLASRARAYVMDRLRGFMPELRPRAASSGWMIAEAARLKTSTNPINETALVRLARRDSEVS